MTLQNYQSHIFSLFRISLHTLTLLPFRCRGMKMKSYNDMYSINDSKLQSSNACHLIHFAKLSNANKLSFQLVFYFQNLINLHSIPLSLSCIIISNSLHQCSCLAIVVRIPPPTPRIYFSSKAHINLLFYARS